MAHNEFFSDEEQNQILQSALRMQEEKILGQKSLEMSAAELGIPLETLEQAKKEVIAKRQWSEFLAYRKAQFKSSIQTYIGFIILFLIINLVTDRSHLWFFYPMIGWGFPMFFKFWSLVGSDQEELQEEYQEYLKNRAARESGNSPQA